MTQSHMTRFSNSQHRERRIERMEENRVTAEMRRKTQSDLLTVPQHPIQAFHSFIAALYINFPLPLLLSYFLLCLKCISSTLEKQSLHYPLGPNDFLLFNSISGLYLLETSCNSLPLSCGLKHSQMSLVVWEAKSS